MEFNIHCPCGCGEIVTATDAGFTATTVEVEPCGFIRGNDPAVVSYNVRKSVAYRLAEGVDTAARHRDGLVALG